MHNLLTIDLEEWFCTPLFKEHISFNEWESLESRIEDNTKLLIDILDNYNTKATFFTLGWIAEHHPKLIDIIISHGHEISSHGYKHEMVYNLTKDEFKTDLNKTRNIILKNNLFEVKGYRAPVFSITENGLDILKEEGYIYDSSIHNVNLHRGYGMKKDIEFGSEIREGLDEFPLTVTNLLGQNISVSGGAYFRFLPFKFIMSRLKNLNNLNRSFIIYLHPWEFDTKQLILKSLKTHEKVRHYYNRKSMVLKLEELLENFHFTSIKNFYELNH